MWKTEKCRHCGVVVKKWFGILNGKDSVCPACNNNGNTKTAKKDWRDCETEQEKNDYIRKNGRW